MDFRFRLFLREHSDASVTVTTLLLPHIKTYHQDRAEAIAAIERSLVDHVKSLERSDLGTLVFNEHQELRQLQLDVQLKNKTSQEPILITLSLLISTEQHSRGERYIVTTPRIPGIYVVVDQDELIETRARETILHHMRKWTPEQVIEADQTGSESIAVVTISVPEPIDEPSGEPLSNTHNQENVLGLCGLSLTAQVTRDRLGHADRREQLVELLLTTLAADRLNSAMLVGRADVGKTALLHEVVKRIQSGKVPSSLRGREVWFVTANNLIAGMKYTGEWQGRTQKLIEQVRRGRQILYMADPNEILDAGRWSGSDNNMGRFLRPYLESGEMTVICECSAEGFAAGMKVEPSFMHAFRRIDVPETDESDTQTIMLATGRRLEALHNISIEPAATTAVLDLTRRFMPYRAFPGKAVRFLDDMIRDASTSAERPIAGRSFGRADVIASFTEKTGLPAFILSDEAALKVPEVRGYFEERLLGQPEAVEAMIDLITVIKAGLNDPNKPLGSFFFVGPTGVGKTELAKVLAEFLFGSRERMIRFDMSEYAAADALPRLIGTAWKPDSEGELTRRVREQPFCVVLFDELEKGHPEVFDALLAVLGEGRLTDSAGRTADFRNAIIIMTSNLGASRREMQAIGFGQSSPDAEDNKRLRDHFVKEAERFFRPEFFNRIDRIVTFRPLTLDAVRLIARRELGKLLMREGVVRRNLLVELDDAVIEQLVAKGFHPLYGARPLQREIERTVILPLARLILERGADHNSLLRFSMRDDTIHLSLVPLDVPDEAAEPTTSSQPAPDKRLETDLAAVMRAIHDLRERTAAEEASPIVQQLRREVGSLLARTREPTFWDEPGAAREVLGRVYHLERVLKRLDSLAEQAEFLEEKGRQIKIHRDRRGVPSLAAELESLAAELSYVQMELAGAGVGQGCDAAIVRVTPLHREAEAWAAQLRAMYIAWANHKGYDVSALDLATGDTSDRRGSGLYLRGSYIYEFLLGEAGLHRLNTGSAEERQRFLARVTVLPAADETPEAIGRRTEPNPHPDNGRDAAVVRVYNQGRHRFVRDPRTGVRQTDLTAVLEQGQIDPFLLACLRLRANTQAEIIEDSRLKIEDY